MVKKRWFNPENGRYYIARIAEDLFGDWSLTLIWGGAKRKGGVIRHIPFSSIFEAMVEIMRIDIKRKRRGYR